MPNVSPISKASKKLRYLAWWAVLLSGPTIYAVDCFFDWLHETYWGLTIVYLCFYFCVLIVFLVIQLYRKSEPHLVTFLFLIFFTVALTTNIRAFISAVGFRWSVYPEKTFITEHCHLVHFTQDGKLESLGFCDLKLDDSGQIDSFSVFYDTSGDVADDYDIETDKHKPDRKEWVDAIRELFNDDPNEQFENLAFQAYPICDHFYTLYFNLPAVVGFTAEYGPPPPNPKNKYQDYNF
jgi:hypothetical protein